MVFSRTYPFLQRFFNNTCSWIREILHLLNITIAVPRVVPVVCQKTQYILQSPDSCYEKKILKMSMQLLILSVFLLVTIVRLFGSLRISTREKLLIMRKSFLISSRNFLILRKDWETCWKKTFFSLTEFIIILTEIHRIKTKPKNNHQNILTI